MDNLPVPSDGLDEGWKLGKQNTTQKQLIVLVRMSQNVAQHALGARLITQQVYVTSVS